MSYVKWRDRLYFKCVAPDLLSFQNFLTNELTSAPNVASVKTSLTIRQSKYLPGVPVE